MNRNHSLVTLGALFVLLLALAPSSARAETHQAYNDAQLQMVIQHDLARKGIEGVMVEVSNHNVTLQGQVNDVWAKNEASRIASGLDEVSSISNELSVRAPESDSALAHEVVRRLRTYVFYTIFDNVDVSVRNGVVTLTGAVTMPYKSEDLTTMASRVPGVQELRDEIRTLPVSSMDDEVRVALARRIYGDPLFSDYAYQVIPPIHIVVDNGRVTLAGDVNSQVERHAAEAIARSVFGVLSVDNQLTVSGSHPAT